MTALDPSLWLTVFFRSALLCVCTHTLISIMTVFFFSKKKLKFEFRSQSAPLRSLFSAFSINVVCFCAKKKTIIMETRVHTPHTPCFTILLLSQHLFVFAVRGRNCCVYAHINTAYTHIIQKNASQFFPPLKNLFVFTLRCCVYMHIYTHRIHAHCIYLLHNFARSQHLFVFAVRGWNCGHRSHVHTSEYVCMYVCMCVCVFRIKILT